MRTDNFDQFDLRFDLINTHEGKLLKQSIWINYQNISPSYSIALKELVKSCQLSGEFEIVTCECGIAGCAGIYKGITVTHETDKVSWKVPSPLSIHEVIKYEGRTDESLHESLKYDTYVFEPNSYIKNIEIALEDAKKIAVENAMHIKCVPFGFELSDLIKLNIQAFS